MPDSLNIFCYTKIYKIPKKRTTNVLDTVVLLVLDYRIPYLLAIEHNQGERQTSHKLPHAGSNSIPVPYYFCPRCIV